MSTSNQLPSLISDHVGYPTPMLKLKGAWSTVMWCHTHTTVVQGHAHLLSINYACTHAQSLTGKKKWQLGGKRKACKMAGNISTLDIGPVIFGDTEELIDFLQQKHLLASIMVCSNCGTAMTLRQKSDISDGCIFRCASCKTTKSLRAGSFFSKSKLTLQQWLVLLYWWVREYPVTDAAEEARVC